MCQQYRVVLGPINVSKPSIKPNVRKILVASKFNIKKVDSTIFFLQTVFILSLRYHTLVNNYIADTFMPTVWPNYMSYNIIKLLWLFLRQYTK